MRLSSITFAVSVVAGCAPNKNQDPPREDPKLMDEAKPPIVKKAPVTKPLPPLAADPGDATGKPAWATSFGGLGIDAPRDVALAANGDVYVAGYFDGEIDFGGAVGKRKAPVAKPTDHTSDGYLAKLGRDGKVAWAQTFGAKREDVANGVAVRGDTIVVVGNFLDEVKFGEFAKKSAGSDDAYVAAFNKEGVNQWAWKIGGIDSDGANTVVAAPDGGWIVGGSFSDTVEFATTTPITLKSKGGTDAMLMKLAASGDLEWVKQFGGAFADQISHLAVDQQGNIYVQGQFKDVADWGGKKPLKAGGGSDNDVVLAKYDLNGDHLWSQRFGNAFNDVAGGVTIDPAGNVTMVGSFDKTVSFGKGDDHRSLGESDIFIARFTTGGKLEWAKTMGAEREDIAFAVASDQAGNTVTTGWFQGTVDLGKGPVTSNGNKDVFALKLDAKGNAVWVKTWGDRDHDQGRGVAIDDAGAAVLVGIYRFQLALTTPPLESVRAEGDRIPKPDAYVVKLDR